MSVGTGTDNAGNSTAAQDQQQKADQAEEKKTADAQTEGEGEGDDEEGEPDPLTVARWAGEETGRPYAEQFRDDKAWIRHVDELERTIGQRNEDAILGKQIRERLAAEGTDVEAVLSGGGKPRKQTDELPELRPEWINFDAEGRMQAMPGAPVDVGRRYLAHLHQYVTQHAKYVDKAVGPALKEIRQQAEKTQAEITERQERQVLDVACDRHRNVLYVGGDKTRGMTPMGQKIADRIGRFAQTGGQAAEMLDAYVEDLAPARETKTNQRQVSHRAVRQPGIAAAAGQSDKELDALLEQGAPGLAKALRESAERQKAAEV